MKISVDGGGLGAKIGKRYGNYTFSENLIKSLSLYDKKNQYRIYTFENLKPKLFWMKGRVSLEELKEKNDIFLALNQAFPLYTSAKIISFCHGLSYHFYPQYFSKKDVARLDNQLKEMIKKSDVIVVSSQKKNQEMTIINYSVKDKIVVLPFGIPFDMCKKSKVKSQKSKYFLFVGMDHKIKNIEFLKEAFKEFNESTGLKDYKLVILTKNCPRKRLQNLYRNATALLTASYYESFNFPVLEALSQGCPVIGLKSAIIPELKHFVNVVNSKKEFVEQMKKIVIKPNVQSNIRLDIEFNWKNYVNNLVELY